MLTIETSPAASAVYPRPKATRARPRFDDGALTRVFKFPSRTHPKSTYYVTSTEVIIRIKKARKKWKLVVPKKRVVSYRTNRWFAKPRWIELELTFTQASRLGLIDPRKKQERVMGDVDAKPQFDTANGCPTEPSIEAAAPPPRQIDASPESEPDHATATEVDALGYFTDDDASDFDLVLDLSEDVTDRNQQDTEVDTHQDTDVELEAPVPEVPESLQPSKEALSHAFHFIPAPDTRQRERSRSKRPHGAMFMALCALLLVSGIGARLTLGTQSNSQTAGTSTCLFSGMTAPCTAAVTTGATAQVERPQSIDVASPAARDAALSSNPIGDPTMLEGATRVDPKKILAVPEVLPDSLPEILAEVPPEVPPEIRREIRREIPSGKPALSLQASGAIELTPPPTMATQETPASPPAIAMAQQNPVQADSLEQPHCRDLAADAQSTSIYFDYASPRLDKTNATVLEALAPRLQSCPSVTIIIQGHTDSDGHEDRNETLSLRRATAVLDYLVALGARHEQLAAVGYGQTRPSLPNVSAENKRRNRRVALVVNSRR